MRDANRGTIAQRLLALALLCCACGCASPASNQIDYQDQVPSDIADALRQLPKIHHLEVGTDRVPLCVEGNLGQLLTAEGVAPKYLPQEVAAVFRLHHNDLILTDSQRDELGMLHLKYRQVKEGRDVIGGELVLHVRRGGLIKSVNATARGVATKVPTEATVTSETACKRAISATSGKDLRNEEPRLVYIISSKTGNMHLAWEVPITGRDKGMPIDDLVYIEATTGEVVDRHPAVQPIAERSVFDAQNKTDLPGAGPRRTELGGVAGDQDVNITFDNTGVVYRFFLQFFKRDSYDSKGAAIVSSVHYDRDLVNAFWFARHRLIAFGDGDGKDSGPLCRSLDVTAHEFTHAVTQHTAKLVYQNEPGALNEAMSDILGAACEWHQARQAIGPNTWKIGEEVWTPGVAGDALRYMDDPARDGISKDFYPDRYLGVDDHGGVHLNSGIANLAFKLTVTGGVHPRRKTTIDVPSIGMEKTVRIYYRALTRYMTSNTDFAGARTATAQAAEDLDGGDERYAIEAGWYAVGVGPAPRK